MASQLIVNRYRKRWWSLHNSVGSLFIGVLIFSRLTWIWYAPFPSNISDNIGIIGLSIMLISGLYLSWKGESTLVLCKNCVYNQAKRGSTFNTISLRNVLGAYNESRRYGDVYIVLISEHMEKYSINMGGDWNISSTIIVNDILKAKEMYRLDCEYDKIIKIIICNE